MNWLFNHILLLVTIWECYSIVISSYEECPRESPKTPGWEERKCKDMCPKYCSEMVYVTRKDPIFPRQVIYECVDAKKFDSGYLWKDQLKLPCMCGQGPLGQECPEYTRKGINKTSEFDCYMKCQDFIIYTLHGEVRACGFDKNEFNKVRSIWKCKEKTDECSCLPDIPLKEVRDPTCEFFSNH